MHSTDTYHLFVQGNYQQHRRGSSAPVVDTASESDHDETGEAAVSDKTSAGSASRKVSAKSLEVLLNGVISMRAMQLNTEVRTETGDP